MGHACSVYRGGTALVYLNRCNMTWEMLRGLDRGLLPLAEELVYNLNGMNDYGAFDELQRAAFILFQWIREVQDRGWRNNGYLPPLPPPPPPEETASIPSMPSLDTLPPIDEEWSFDHPLMYDE